MSGIVVVGAGQAGAALVAKLRAEGYEGALTLLGEEGVPPYQRPPLSKAYLLGEMSMDRLFLRPESFYAEAGIELRPSQGAVSIDRADKVVIAGDEAIPYDQLALTTGSVPRRLPDAIGGALEGVHVVRGLADVDMMAPGFVAGRHMLVVGGGYIGLEAAAVAAKRGLRVTLIEMSDRILQRVAAPETSDFFRALHRRHGVEICEGTGLEHLSGDQRVTGAVLSDGRRLDVDIVVVGIGITPATELALAAGLEVENGIVTDIHGRSSDPAIWAAGDCASFPWKGGRLRLESVQNAIDQAECVARNMLGQQVAYQPSPWFWSDQFDVKLQIAGLNTGYARVISRPGPAGSDASSYWYFDAKDGLLAVDAMNDPRAYMVGKRLIEAGKSPDPGVLTDPATDLKSLLRG